MEPMKFLLEFKANGEAAGERGGAPMSGWDWKEGRGLEKVMGETELDKHQPVGYRFLKGD